MFVAVPARVWGRVSMGGEVALQCLYCSLVYKSSTINRPTGTVAPKGSVDAVASSIEERTAVVDMRLTPAAPTE